MGEFIYKTPDFRYDEEGNMQIINKRCVGPIEVIIYGINKNKEFYFDWTYPEFYPDDSELKKDYRIITKEEMVEEIKVEISICKKEGNIGLIEKYYQSIDMIEKNQY